ncbi:MAG: transposase [Phycisphaerae bacterium]|nr:transposase [Phycisphaerae bacterium]
MRRWDGTVRKTREAFEDPGHAHELTFTCFQGLPLLSKDRTRQWFISALQEARKKFDLELWAYVIMPEHAHVLLLPRRDDYRVGKILKAVKQPVAQRAVHHLKEHAPEWLSRLRIFRSDGRVVHRFWQQGGGYDRNIRKAGTAWKSVRYIHGNPVRRGLVARAEDWPWSSAGWYTGRERVKLAMDARPPDPPPR